MPKKEINNYIFYKIVCLDNSVDLCYIGSTANWKARNHQHKIIVIMKIVKNIIKIYKIIRENGGWTNFKMIEIGKREQLTKREAEQVEEDIELS
jgi:tRNA A58 N-methylase Trm61